MMSNGDGQRWNNCMITMGVMCLYFVVSVIIIFYHVYVRFYYNRTQCSRGRTLGTSRASRWSGEDYFFTPAAEGLCRQALDALPVFVYKPGNFKDGLRCAICFREFDEKERGRLLRICNHSFHLDCIDMWFSSHSTCPICRGSVEKQPDEVLQSPVSTTRVIISVTEEDESSTAAQHRLKGNSNQHSTDYDSNIVMEIGITIHDIPANGK